MYLTILWFSLNCLSFSLSSRSAELFVQDYIDSLRMKRLIRLLHLFFEFVFHLAVKLYFPFSFGKTNYLFKIICPLLFVSTQIFLLFDCQRSFAPPVPLSFGSMMYIGFGSVLRVLAAGTAGWSVWMDSNHRPRAYQARALAT